jgi:predicted DNA-binding ribbon-helix-helix protein
MPTSSESYDARPTHHSDTVETVGGPSLGAMKKRSVVLAGHRTSVSLENAFWDALKTIAGNRSSTVNQLVTEIDKQRDGNLSSAIRVYVLRSLQSELTTARNGAPAVSTLPSEPLQ